jgi:hypothetical protein
MPLGGLNEGDESKQQLIREVSKNTSSQKIERNFCLVQYVYPLKFQWKIITISISVSTDNKPNEGLSYIVTQQRDFDMKNVLSMHVVNSIDFLTTAALQNKHNLFKCCTYLRANLKSLAASNKSMKIQTTKTQNYIKRR